jgi:ABC-type phosphate transport system substrate-binding protein
MSRMRRVRTLLFLLWTIAATSFVYAKQLAVVTDTANQTRNLSAAELIKLFNAHIRNWGDGKPVIVVVRDPASSDMELVLRKVFNMTPPQARSFIQAHKPSIVIAGSDDAVLRFVSSNRGAIGIVDLYSLTKDVNVVKIDGKLPVEQGYLLRGN